MFLDLLCGKTFVSHSGTARSAGPGIQKATP
jgi:hypothetical protein